MLGKNIKAARKLAEVEKYDLAYSLQVTEQEVADWEKGRIIPDLLTIYGISERLGVSLDFLLKGKILDSSSLKERAIIRAYRRSDMKIQSKIDDILGVPHEAIPDIEAANENILPRRHRQKKRRNEDA